MPAWRVAGEFHPGSLRGHLVSGDACVRQLGSLLLAIAVTAASDATRPDAGLIQTLHVPGTADDHPGEIMLFGRFVGSWHLEWAWNGTSDQPAEMSGELHFGWVLGGRGIV